MVLIWQLNPEAPAECDDVEETLFSGLWSVRDQTSYSGQIRRAGSSSVIPSRVGAAGSRVVAISEVHRLRRYHRQSRRHGHQPQVGPHRPY